MIKWHFFDRYPKITRIHSRRHILFLLSRKPKYKVMIVSLTIASLVMTSFLVEAIGRINIRSPSIQRSQAIRSGLLQEHSIRQNALMNNFTLENNTAKRMSALAAIPNGYTLTVTPSNQAYLTLAKGSLQTESFFEDLGLPRITLDRGRWLSNSEKSQLFDRFQLQHFLPKTPTLKETVKREYDGRFSFGLASPLSGGVEKVQPPLREVIAETLDALSPDFGQWLKNDNKWTTDLSPEYTIQVGQSVDRIKLAASQIDTTNVVIFSSGITYDNDGLRFTRLPATLINPNPNPLDRNSINDVLVHTKWYRAHAISYMSKSLSGMQNTRYNDESTFVSDLRNNLSDPQTRDRNESVTTLDNDLAATARYINFQFDPSQDVLKMSASTDQNDLVEVKYYEAELPLTLRDIAHEVIDKQDGVIVGDYGRVISASAAGY